MAALAKENAERKAEAKEQGTEADTFEIPKGYTMRGARRTFATLTRKNGADRELLKRYLGQSAGDVLGEHYDRIDVADLKPVAEAFNRAFSVNNLSTASKQAVG